MVILPKMSILTVLILMFPLLHAAGTGLRETPTPPPVPLPHREVLVAIIVPPDVDSDIRRGAADAAREITLAAGGEGSVRIIREITLSEAALDLQVNQIENAITSGAHAILVDPVDPEGVIPYLENARRAGVVVISVNNPVSGDERASQIVAAHVGTDTRIATAQVVDELMRHLGRTGAVTVIPGDLRREQNQHRRDGFVSRFHQAYPGVRILEPRRRGVTSAEDAATAVYGVLANNPDAGGIIATDSVSTIGAGRGVEQAGRIGAVTVIGFDRTSAGLELLRDGAIQGLLWESPRSTGYTAVYRALQELRGEPAPPVVAVPYRFFGGEIGDFPEQVFLE